MTPEDEGLLLRELAMMSAKCQATMAHIGEWEREFNKPVVSSTQAAIWAMARQLGGERISGFGRLLEQMPAG